MAVIKAYVPVDFAYGGLPTGYVTKANSTEVVIDNGYAAVTFRGHGFTFAGEYVTGGTLNSFTVTYSGQIAIEGYGLNLFAPVVAEDILTGDLHGLLLYALSGNDEIYGSEYTDIIAGGPGDDYFDPNSGDDAVFGASGTDTIFLAGTLSDYALTPISPEVIQVADINLSNGNEGVDTLYEIEVLAFGSGESYFVSSLVNPVIWNQQSESVELVAATYQFFTGTIPTAEGFEYLISSLSNPNDLNDPYYAAFNTENRFINFASNLGTAGAGADEFDSRYGSLSYADAVSLAYMEIMGEPLEGGALDFFMGATGYYQAVAMERVVRPGVDLDAATKIVAVGSILNEAMKLGQGPYADAIDDLVQDVYADGYSTSLGDDLFPYA